MTPRFIPADLGVMHVAIRTWAVAQLSGYAVIWANQDGPYPGHPYAVLRVVSPPGSVGGHPVTTLVPGTSDVTRTEYDSEFTVRVELLSRAVLDSTTGLDVTTSGVHSLEASLWTAPQLEAFNVAGLALVSVSKPQSIPSIAGFGFERRAYIDVLFRARTRIDSATPVLDDTSFAVGTVLVDGVLEGTLGV